MGAPGLRRRLRRRLLGGSSDLRCPSTAALPPSLPQPPPLPLLLLLLLPLPLLPLSLLPLLVGAVEEGAARRRLRLSQQV